MKLPSEGNTHEAQPFPRDRRKMRFRTNNDNSQRRSCNNRHTKNRITDIGGGGRGGGRGEGEEGVGLE